MPRNGKIARAISYVDEVIAGDDQHAFEPPVARDAKREKASAHIAAGAPRLDVRAVERMFEHVSVVHALDSADIGRAVGWLVIDLVLPRRSITDDARSARESALASEQQKLAIREIGK